MKPWKETWRTFGWRVQRRRSDGTWIDLLDKDRARLAAAAPEMARLLLDWHRDGVTLPCGGLGNVSGCPDCAEITGHATDCRLVVVLRKAGVLP